MNAGERTFSESWYRIADKRVHLRPGVRIRRQNFRGQRWHVVENPFNNQYFRLRPEAYAFVARLSPRFTVDEAWKACLEEDPENAPGQEAVVRLLSQLYAANLLQYEQAEDAARLFERHSKRVRREVGARLAGIMFMRIPLWDPDRFLKATLPVVGWLVSWIGAILWLVVVGLAGKVVVDEFPALVSESRQVFSPSNLVLLYGGLVVIKVFHEFGHAYFCRKFGGEVHVMGVMFLIFTPLPYVDATSSWSFRSRWQRLLVGAAGMIVEVFVAAIAVFIWARTAPGALHSLAFNMIFLASVSTVLFNLNPLLRFDGYYMLSDLLDIPNMHERSWKLISHGVKKNIFGLKDHKPPMIAPGEKGWLVGFGILSNIYRFVVFGGILLFVADQFLLLGIIMAVLCVTGWIIVPLGKFTRYLASSPELDRQRGRAVGASLAVIGGLVAFLALVPFPAHVRAQGLVHADLRADVTSRVEGEVVELLAEPGAQVRRGQPLVRLTDPSRGWERDVARSRLAEVDALILKARNEDSASLDPLQRRRVSVVRRLARMEADLAAEVVTAPIDGLWVAPGVEHQVGRWLSRGTRLGRVVHPEGSHFRAVVTQEDADRLFEGEMRRPEVRLRGRADQNLPVSKLQVIPADQTQLPSAALGWSGGGDMPVSSQDPEGRQSAEPFFLIRASLAPQPGLPSAPDGRSGEIRFRIEDEPILSFWGRRLWQLLQKRYQF